MKQIIVRLKETKFKKMPYTIKKARYFTSKEFFGRMPSDFQNIRIGQYIETTIGKEKVVITFKDINDYCCDHWQWFMNNDDAISDLIQSKAKTRIKTYLDE